MKLTIVYKKNKDKLSEGLAETCTEYKCSGRTQRVSRIYIVTLKKLSSIERLLRWRVIFVLIATITEFFCSDRSDHVKANL